MSRLPFLRQGDAPELARKKAPRVGPIPAEAIAWFGAKNIEPSFDFDDTWADEYHRAFRVAGMTQEALLGDIKDELTRMLEEGETFEEFKRTLEERLTRQGWWGDQANPPSRLKLIYQTNLRMARAHGQWDRMQRTAADMPIAEYNLGPAEEHRDDHVRIAGTRAPLDSAWWREHFPPLGYNCHCWVLQLSERQAEKRGGLTPTDDSSRDWINPKTGETRSLPIGVEPGFEDTPPKRRP